MKKIIIILLVLIFSSNLFSQNLRKLIVVSGYHFTSTDTVFFIPTSDNYSWGAIIAATSLDTTNATVTAVVSKDGTNWIDYAGNLTTTLNDTTCYKAFEDYQTAFSYLGFRVKKNSVTSGTLGIYLTLNTNK